MFSELLSEGGLSLDRLRSFCLVAEAGGVTKAAKGEASKQTLYSRQIKELEEFFGVELMRRSGRGMVLTSAGTRLNALARECFASLLDFKSECKGRPVEIVLGAGESIIAWVLLPHLAEVRERLPKVRLKFLNLTTKDIVRGLGDGILDFGVVRRDAVSRPLQAAALGVMRYSLFVPEGLRRADGPKVLEALPMAILSGEGSFRRQLAAIAARHRLRLNIEIECASFPLVVRAVREAHVAGILPSAAAVELGQAGVEELNVAVLDSLKRETCLAWNPRMVKIRTGLRKAGEVFSDLFRM